MPRINQLPAASSVGATDVVAVDTENGTLRAPKSTLFDGYYTAAEVDAAIAQSTAWSNNWLTNTSILAYAASVANPSFTTFRTSATSTDVPIANEYYIGTVERYGQNITVKMTTMQDASKMYINNSVNGGSTWTGWKTFLDYAQSTATETITPTIASGITTSNLSVLKSGNTVVINGAAIIGSTALPGNNGVLFTLPVGCRPSTYRSFYCEATYNGNLIYATFRAAPYGNIESLTGSGTFGAGTAVRFISTVFML
jgi:hypothetical protein